MGPTIYLARHGERLDFVDPSWCDTAENPHDAPLTARGEQQARELGVRLRDCNIAHVFASPFSRVTCTAVRAAAELANPCRVKLESGNCEWLNADWYAHAPRWPSVAQLAEKFPTVDPSYAPVFGHDANVARFPELRSQMVERTGRTADQLVKKYGADGNLLFVGHGSSVEAFYESLVPHARRKPLKVSYCSLTVCAPQPDGTYDAEVLADSGHLSSPEDQAKTRYI